jgi:pimeloyl-ACP methyl ester carboxylesterase
MSCSVSWCSMGKFSTALLLAASITISAQHRGSNPVLNPAQGDGGVSAFYVWDKEVPHTPGLLLRQEPLPENLDLANASQSIRVLYSSTDGIDGKSPITVSGAVYLPKGTVPTAGWPVIAWAHGTTGIADVCAPSWAPRSPRDTDYLNAWLAQGYAVVATDYQGLGTPGPHPRHATKPEAWSVLDGVRSALKAFPQLANSVVFVGQSQGAHAALSAALLAKEYAPSLTVKGTIATGLSIYFPFEPPTKAPQIAVPPRTGGGMNAAVALLELYTYMALDPTFNPSNYLSDAAKPVFELARTACFTDMIITADQHQVTAENALKENPELSKAGLADYERYPMPRFAQPVFIGTGLADKTAFPEGQYNFVMAACYAGSTVEAHYYPGKDHGGTVLASLVDSVPFARKVFASQIIAGNCSSVKPPASAEIK